MVKKVSFSQGKVIIPLLVFIFLVTSNLLAGTTGKIAGRVFDQSTGEPLIGANVMVAGTLMGASTDQDGFYFIINVPPGNYSVTVSYMGYEGVTKSEVRVTVDRTTSLDFSLKPAVIEGQMVTVVAERPVVEKDLTASEQVVTTEILDQSWVRSIPEAMEIQTGVFQGHFRGGTKVESVYMLDNVSMNSGLLSDNYTGINTSTIQEIAVLTGGYNAEYGSAQSGIVNIVTKEGGAGIHGTAITRMRPAGKYHWGRNMYSKDNYDWVNFDLAYWTAESQNTESEFYGQDPNELLTQWHKQITADPTQGDYANRPEYETEVTLYGSATEKLGFLLSGRYKRGVNIFPQQEKYNPEFNFQGNLSYKITDAIKLKVSGLYGGYTTSAMSPSNFNTVENSQEMAWNGLPQVIDPYQWNKYAIPGSWCGWPELRRISNFSLKWTHTLSPKTFYEIDVSYLYDNMDKTDRDNVVPEDKWSFDEEEFGMLWFYQAQGYKHWEDKWESKVYSLRGDITSQVTKNHHVKAGFMAKSYDFSYDHQMSAYEGGERWNLMNVYEGTPYEGTLYAQDKIEFSGLIVNAGLRVDFFNQNREAPRNMFDPLAFEETTPGNVTSGFPGNPEKEQTKLQAAMAPRLGISHPISENTVLHFVYGHFYQRPSWHKMLGFPYINFTDDWDKVYEPYDPGTMTFMDQWMGFYGNPKMGYERTIQYEIGVDQNIVDLVRLDVTGYYKDASRQTIFREATLYDPRWDDQTSWTWLYNATNQYNIAMMVSNCAYADIRGLEARLDTRFNWPLNLSLSYDLSYTTGGVVGYSNMYELGSGIDSPQGYAQIKKVWNSNHKFKGVANLNFRQGFGPEIAGFKPLSNINMNVYFEYWNGQQYTYHGPGDPSTKPNNKRWYPHYRTNLKVSKGFQVMSIHTELSLEIRNLFNNKDINMLGWDDLVYYQENSDLSLEERLPKHWWSGEPNEWGWYNMWTNPPRQVYLQLKVDF